MEQFQRLSDETVFSKEEQSIYENELYRQLSQKEKVFNIKTSRVEECISIMDNTLNALANIK